MEYNDSDLVQKACRGESRAFDILAQKYWEWAFAIASGLVNDFAAAQDVTQESFVNAWQRLHQLNNPERFKQWLRRIVMNQAMMYLRHKKSTVSLEEVVESSAIYSETPEKKIIKQETIELVNKSMQNLTLRHRLLLELFYMDGLSQRDIGDLLEISEQIVKSRLHDARTKLRREIMMENSKEHDRRIVVSLSGVSLEPLGDDSPKLEDINLEVKEGEFFVLTGHKGCGKDETLRIIGLLEKPDSGIVEINGVDISALEPFKFVELKVGVFGYVWQHPQLSYHTSAVENVILPLVAGGFKKSNCIERTVEIFRFVGLEDKKRKLPVRQLSILEQQRVVLARALITDPAVIIAQEPTGNMVPDDGQEFAGLLRRTTEERNVAVVCASHDLKIINMADRVAWMQNGRIAKIGTPNEGAPPKVGKGNFIVRYPGNICEWLYHSGKYTGIKRELLHEASEKYKQAIEKVTFLRAKPESTVEERIELRINELRESINLLSNVVSNLERV
jgi:putative ABC transport system ATP-binding protein